MTHSGEMDGSAAARHDGDSPVVRDVLRGALDSAAVGSLVTSLVHSGNNRLTVILSCLDLLDGADVSAEDVRAAIALATGAAQQLATDFSTLLTGVRRRAPQPATVELAPAVQSAIRLDAFLHDSGLQAVSDVPAGLAVEVERGRLEAALLRLWVFGRRRGARAIRVGGRPLEVEARTAARPALRKGRYCCLEVDLVGASLPDLLVHETAEPGHVVERLGDPDGLEYAAVEAFVGSLRGHLTAHAERDRVRIELYLPASNKAD